MIRARLEVFVDIEMNSIDTNLLALAIRQCMMYGVKAIHSKIKQEDEMIDGKRKLSDIWEIINRIPAHQTDANLMSLQILDDPNES